MDRNFVDQMGNHLYLPGRPKRIISLVPSQTELLFELGLNQEIIGITKFCIHPGLHCKKKIKIGGTKQLKIDLIKKLQPDLIIGNKEENDKSQIETLSKEFRVWMSDIANLEDALSMILQLGQITGRALKAKKIIVEIKKEFDNLKRRHVSINAAYFIWRAPYMVVGNGTFIHEMMQWAGFENVFKNQDRYPEIDLKELTNYPLDVILLSSEPFPFKEKHKIEFYQFCPKAVIQLVNGELFSWYGSRLLQSAAYFRNLQSDLQQQLLNPKTLKP